MKRKLICLALLSIFSSSSLISCGNEIPLIEITEEEADEIISNYDETWIDSLKTIDSQTEGDVNRIEQIDITEGEYYYYLFTDDEDLDGFDPFEILYCYDYYERYCLYINAEEVKIIFPTTEEGVIYNVSKVYNEFISVATISYYKDEYLASLEEYEINYYLYDNLLRLVVSYPYTITNSKGGETATTNVVLSILFNDYGYVTEILETRSTDSKELSYKTTISYNTTFEKKSRIIYLMSYV